MRQFIDKFKRLELALVALGLTLLGSGGYALAATQSSQSGASQTFQAILTPQNGTSAYGVATGTVGTSGMAHFHITVSNLINAPHAQHIHFGATAEHQCPSPKADANNDGVVDTTEGGSAYGPVQTSLTTAGDTSPSSTLAVDRYPSYANGAQYDRTFQLTPEQAQQVRSGLSVVVIHGIDTLQKDGKYDGNLKSDLDPSLPQEATAPAACGPFHEISAAAAVGNNNSTGSSASGQSYGSSTSNKTISYIALALGAIALLVALGALSRPRTNAQPRA